MSSKSTQTPSDNTKWYEEVINELQPTPNTELENQVQVLIRMVAEMGEKINKLENMNLYYKKPGGKEHMKLADYLHTVEERLNSIEIRQELDV